MELTVIQGELKRKISEAKKLSRFNSRHFAFKNWHATVMQLLRELPPSYVQEINDFKKLSFEDTRFKRGRKFFTGPDNSRFIEDLQTSIDILTGIVKKGGTDKKREDSAVPAEEKKKPAKPQAENKKTSSKTEKTPVKKAGKAKTSKKESGNSKTPVTRKPAKKGSSSTRKKKQ